MSEIKFFNEIREPKVSELGGKGYSLVVLINNGFNVPNGFILPSGCFFKFLRENNLIEKIERLTTNIDENNVQHISNKIKNLILNGEMPKDIIFEIKDSLTKIKTKYVAVRSSAIGEDMGDDIIWPLIRKMLLENVKKEDKIDEYIAILSLPIERSTSTEFYNDIVQLANKSSDLIRSIIFSNIEIDNALEIIQNLDGYQEFESELQKVVEKWWWMRDRDLYFEPIDNKKGMIEFIRKHFSPEYVKQIDFTSNTDQIKKCVEEVENFLPKKLFDDFVFYLKFGKFLHKERDDHHHLWLKNTAIIRDLFLELGRRLQTKKILHDARDIFFLTVPEIFKLFSENISKNRRNKIIEKIPNRMVAYSLVSKCKLHQRPGYEIKEGPKHDGEYY